MQEEKILEDRKKKLAELFTKKNVIIAVLGVLILLILAWHIRTANVSGLKDITTKDYTLGPDLDPFLFLRYAQYINDHGSLMKIDEMRNVPLGYNTAGETRLLPYMIYYFHKVISPMTHKSINYSAAMFPVFMFLLTVVAFFIFIRKIFEDNEYKDYISFVATLLLVVSPSLLSRTVAGIPEKESAGFFFLFMAFYFFISAWRSEKLKNSIILGVLSGISTALMGMVWGGWIYVFITIALFTFIAFVFGKFGKREFFVYLSWFIFSVGVVDLFGRYSIKSLAMSTSSGLSFLVFFIVLVDFIIFNTKIKDIQFVNRMRKILSDRVFSIITAAVLGLILATLFFGISFLPSFFSDIIDHLTKPYTDRLAFTVAENRQPYFDEWKGSFGPIIAGKIPLFFWLFFIGSIFLFYLVVKDMEKRGKWILTSAYSIFIFALIFSRSSQSGLLNGANSISKILYFGSFVLLGASVIYLYYTYHKENNLEEFKKINFPYLFLLVYFIPGLIGARSAIRLLMALVPPAVGIIGFFAVFAVENSKKRGDETARAIAISLAVIIILASCYTVYDNYKSVIGTAKQMIPSSYTQQWQKAMAWVRSNTPENSVFAHWWDYGYWVQTMGLRPTIVDGGNNKAYWNYLMGRFVLTGQNEQEALDMLYAHNSSYLLIDSTDIGKYSAYSNIGSDENYDRFSWIGTYILNEQATQEKKNETVVLYQGGTVLDEDYVWKDSSNRSIYLPAGRAGVGGIFLTATSTGIFKQPEAVFIYNNQQTAIPLRYLYYKGNLTDFGSGYQGVLYIMPRLTSSSQGASINDKGAALFLSERNFRALWVKIYLLGQGTNFQVAHKEDNVIVASLKQQKLIPENQDFIYFGDTIGPIKIWKINYPENMVFKPEFLSTDYPESILIAKQTF